MSLKFLEELNSKLLKIDINNANPLEFTNIVISVLDKDAPKKKKFLRAKTQVLRRKKCGKKSCRGVNFETNFKKIEQIKGTIMQL